MDTIMQWTDGAVTAAATLSFALTVLAGIWLSAKFGKITLIPAVIIIAVSFYIRVQVPAVSAVAIVSMSAMHVAAACLLGLWLRRRKSFGARPSK